MKIGEIYKGYIYLGGDLDDKKSWRAVKPSLKQSMREEVASRNPFGVAAAGLGTALDSAAYGAKSLFGKLSPQEQERLELNQVIKERPAGRVGNIAGNIAMTAAPYAGVAKLATRAPAVLGPLATVAGSGALGAGWGAMTHPENRTGGALQEGLGAALGASLGQMAAGPFRPQYGSQAALLQKEGVPITPGQAGGGLSHLLEDVTRKVNTSVRRRQVESLADTNRVLVNESLKTAKLPTVTGRGHDMLEAAQKEFSSAYQRLGSKPLPADLTYMQRQGKVLSDVLPDLSPESAAALESKVREIGNNFARGARTSSFRELERELNGLARNAANDQKGALARAYSAIADELEALRGRKGLATPELDLAYAQFSRMKEAAAARGAMDEGIFSMGQLRAAIANASSKDQRAFGKALLQPRVADVQKVMGDTIPAVGPGTGETVLWGTTIPGAATASYVTGNPAPIAATLGLLGANKLMYSTVGSKLATGYYPWQQMMSPNAQGLFASSGAALGSK